MGMYTEFVFGAELKQDTPDFVINILKYMITDDPRRNDLQVDRHVLFQTDRWHQIGLCCSYYFGFSKPCSKIYFDDISKSWKFAIRCSIKNYDDEIEKFIDWITPFIERGSGERDFLGYSLYEEDEVPILYYLRSEMQ